jgi:hypothetical protein
MAWTIGLTVPMLILLYKCNPSCSCSCSCSCASVIHLVPVSDLVGILYLTADDNAGGAVTAAVMILWPVGCGRCWW